MKLEDKIKRIFNKVLAEGSNILPKAYLERKFSSKAGKHYNIMALKFNDDLTITYDGIGITAKSNNDTIKLFLEDINKQYRLYKKGLDNNYRDLQRESDELTKLFIKVYKYSKAKNYAMGINDKLKRISFDELKENIKNAKPRIEVIMES